MRNYVIASISAAILALITFPVKTTAQPAPAPIGTSTEQQSANDYNYVGIGLNTEGFTATSKFRLTERFSLRPTVLLDEDTNFSILVPVTYDFAPPIESAKELLPYAGVGLGAVTEDDWSVGAVLTAGADYRFSRQFTANASVNWALFDNGGVDLVLSVGYTF